VRIRWRGNTIADADCNCDTHSHTNFNSATYSNAQGYSDTKTSPHSAASADPVTVKVYGD
jgi:hypothetical protein